MAEAAASVLKRAVTHDQAGEVGDALVCYREGIQLLMDALKGLGPGEEQKRQGYRQKIESYMERAEALKKFQKEEAAASRYLEQLHIEANSTGHSYERVFGRLLNERLTAVVVEDPYIRSVHQIYNFLRFCEMLVKSPAPVKSVRLVTSHDEGSRDQQAERLRHLQESLKQHTVELEIEYSDTLHDRQIRFNNGWIVKMGRGLDYFKPPPSKFSMGYCDFDLRKCHETSIDTFPESKTKQM